jgi:hypothetical protein
MQVQGQNFDHCHCKKNNNNNDMIITQRIIIIPINYLTYSKLLVQMRSNGCMYKQSSKYVSLDILSNPTPFTRCETYTF